ncbi:MAG: branched-chain amino acid ABC transporter permease [Halobaculum sp.]
MALASSLVSLGTFVAIYALLALGLNLKFGYNGLLDIGHVTFYLIGAYTTALLVLGPSSEQEFATYILGLDLPWVIALAVAVVVAGVGGMLVALPAIRLREDYLAIVVLGFSVIAKRIVQTQSWLANGPGSLRGYTGPLRDVFALPAYGAEAAEVVVPAFLASEKVVLASVPSELVFGGVVFVLAAIGSYLLVEVGDMTRPTGTAGRVRHAVYAVTTLGVGYVAARRTAETGSGLPPVLAGVAAGAVAAGLSLAGLPGVATLVVLGGLSLFTWVLGLAAVTDRYAGMSRRDAGTALGLAVTFVAAFLPVILLGGDVGGTIGLLVTLAALVGFVYGLYRLASAWDQYGSGSAFVSVVGVGALWLFVLRYFVLALVGPVTSGGVGNAVANLIQNTLWLVKFTESGPAFDYARFVFVLTLAVLGVVYLLVERTVNSPFGRVLKAIREDEDVATALGKDTFSFKIQSMIIGSAIAGLAGGLWALSVGALVHNMFAPRVTFIVLLMVIIGGTANNSGAILGAVVFWAFQKGTADIAGFFPTAARSSIQALRLAFIGALLIVILYYRPEGIWKERTVTSPALDADAMTADAADVDADPEVSD